MHDMIFLSLKINQRNKNAFGCLPLKYTSMYRYVLLACLCVYVCVCVLFFFENARMFVCICVQYVYVCLYVYWRDLDSEYILYLTMGNYVVCSQIHIDNA